jgi:uncharacterized protein YdaU (DUF1376 family)
MADYPAMPLMTDAYLADTQHLSNEEHGVYLRLLIIAWRSPDCSLPDDDKRLAIMLGVTLIRWRDKLKPVIAPFWIIQNGAWTQKKQLEVRKKVEKNVKQKRIAYEQTERAKRLKHNETYEPADSSHDPPTDESTKTKTKKEESGLGFKGRSLRPAASGCDPNKPDPEKFTFTSDWTMSDSVADRLADRFRPQLGVEPFWRQIARFIGHHANLGTVDDQPGFERRLEGWLERADDNVRQASRR